MQTMKEHMFRVVVQDALAQGMVVCGQRFAPLTEDEAVTLLLQDGPDRVSVVTRDKHEREVRAALSYYDDLCERSEATARHHSHRKHYAALAAAYDDRPCQPPQTKRPLDIATRDYVLREIAQSLLRRALISYETADATALPGHAQQCRTLANELRRIAEDDIPAMRWPANIPEDK